ncbi:unnamed protein product [Meganyctiphanes norvegica]|uniref:Uncharacterized protein n=1 Tax=Meganyctiphanes norvegica TaxID=48144 RepID=A0AAV2RLF2_MEGNR
MYVYIYIQYSVSNNVLRSICGKASCKVDGNKPKIILPVKATCIRKKNLTVLMIRTVKLKITKKMMMITMMTMTKMTMTIIATTITMTMILHQMNLTMIWKRFH